MTLAEHVGGGTDYGADENHENDVDEVWRRNVHAVTVLIDETLAKGVDTEGGRMIITVPLANNRDAD